MSAEVRKRRKGDCCHGADHHKIPHGHRDYELSACCQHRYPKVDSRRILSDDKEPNR